MQEFFFKILSANELLPVNNICIVYFHFSKIGASPLEKGKIITLKVSFANQI